jgi:hypothetical protein
MAIVAFVSTVISMSLEAAQIKGQLHLILSSIPSRLIPDARPFSCHPRLSRMLVHVTITNAPSLSWVLLL